MNKEVNKETKPVAAEMPMVDRHHMWFLVGIPIIAILILGAFVGGMIWASNGGADSTDEVAEGVVEDVLDEDGELVEDEVDPLIVGAPGELSISWYPDSAREQQDPVIDFYYSPDDVNAVKGSAVQLGVVEGGEYDGRELVLNVAMTPGLGISFTYYYSLHDLAGAELPVILDQYFSQSGSIFQNAVGYSSAVESFSNNDELFAELVDLAQFDTLATISELESADSIQSTNGHSFVLEGIWRHEDLAVESEGELIAYDFSGYDIVGYTTGPGFPIYELSGDDFLNLFAVPRVDGRILIYDIDIPFFTPESYYSGIPDMTWNNGDGVETYIKAKQGGCGYATLTNVVDTFSLPELTRKSGLTVDGEGILEPLPPDSYYDEQYDTWLTWHEDGTRDEFVDLHPVFFWEDSLGRMIQFTHQDALAQAECGKPVIYLYPEETTHMVVEVEPQGGFTYTEPDYGDGWEVIAYPDGYVKNIADGDIYPYLFWEGRGGLYSEPANYWVVAQAEVEPFLVKTLARLGLQDREIAEFMEFWVPRMEDAAYYKIGFHGTEVMDAIAPITLSQEADSILRILMDFSELDAPEPSNPPRFIPHFEREGFSLVEWGGVIR